MDFQNNIETGETLKLKISILILLAIMLFCLSPLAAESFGERSAKALEEKGVSPWMIVILISMLPIVELRGAIPVAIFLFGMSWQQAALLSIIGNMLPIPFILLLLEWFLKLISRFKWGKKLTDWLWTRGRSKGKLVERYKELGLIVFVGIPLPGTGGWTGSLAATVFGLSFWKSLFCVFIGVLLAAVAVTLISVLGISVLGI